MHPAAPAFAWTAVTNGAFITLVCELGFDEGTSPRQQVSGIAWGSKGGPWCALDGPSKGHALACLRPL